MPGVPTPLELSPSSMTTMHDYKALGAYLTPPMLRLLSSKAQGCNDF